MRVPLMKTGGLLLLIGLLTGLVTAQSTEQAPPTPATPSPTVGPVMAPSPDSTSTPRLPITLSIWWADTLAPLQGESASLRAEQLRAITEAVPGVRVDVRLKAVNGPGGMREALLTADAVAPRALPDLALVARRDLLALIDAGLAQPIDQAVSQADRDRFYPVAIALSEINGRLYALPYALELHHLAYQPPAADLGTFAGSLDAGRDLLLPLGGEALLATLLAQYVSCGGVLENGLLTNLEEAPLRALLEYYAEARTRTLDPRSAQYASLADTLPLLPEAGAGLVNTAGYQSLLAADPDWRFTTAPLASETPVTVVEGWLWVILTPEPGRQAAALTVINALLQTERLAGYSHLVGALPSTPAALAAWSDADYAAFMGGLLANALPLLGETREQAGMRLLTAMRQVVNGGTVEEALTVALADG
jgi:ABC-type glycerol-3-phosphate transport system substrate-binding protein